MFRFPALAVLACLTLLPIPAVPPAGAQTTTGAGAVTGAVTDRPEKADGPRFAPGARSAAEARAARPDLFDTETGFRIGRQRAPTPADIPPPARRIGTAEAEIALRSGALPLDVFGATRSRYDELDGTWLVSRARLSLPGALWLPEVGRGRLTPEMQRYLSREVATRMSGSEGRAIVVFCIADCWMSWNAAQRLAQMGYRDVLWFREGTDGWAQAGLPLEPATPVPVPVD